MEKESITEKQRVPIEMFNETGKDLKKREIEIVKHKKNKVHDIMSKGLREEIQDIKEDVLERVSNRMNEMMSEILERLDRMPSNKSNDLVDSEKYSNRTKQTREDVLPTKQFLQRNSLLTDLYEIKHIRTICNLFLVTLILLLIHTAIYDIRHTGTLNLGIDTIRAGFGKFPIVLCIWPFMVTSALGVHVAFCYWATRCHKYSPKSPARKIWDYMWLTGMFLYEILLFALPTKALLDYDLPLACSIIILMEEIRLVMKTYAFVRSVAPRFLSYKPHSDTSAPKLPGFSKYLYFMFAPTLIYQDSYPRSNKIRWNVVVINFVEVLTIIVLVALLYERLLFPTFRDFGKQPIELEILILNILSSMLPGILLFLCGFYLLMHSWMNAFAELLQFSDKMFYKDWWNSDCYSVYYRTWNIVVHDWLYTYIYKDMYEIITPRNKTLSVCTVFAISSIFHEYIICFSNRFFYPVMLLLFGGPGLAFVLVLKSTGNAFFWFSLSIGSGTMVSLYCMEYYARENCPSVRDDFWNFVIPRTWTCIFK